MSSHSTGLFRRTSYPKYFPLQRNRCSVCLCNRSTQSFTTNYCCSTFTKHVRRQVCDTCVHQHVLAKLYSCLTASIICPEMNCSVYLNPSIICELLLTYDSNQLLNDYLREQQWQGKSEEWINRFAARCPCCSIPIEKNGGCDEMICTRCQTHFYWSKAKRYLQMKKKQTERSFVLFHPLIDGILFVIFLLCIVLSMVIYFR